MRGSDIPGVQSCDFLRKFKYNGVLIRLQKMHMNETEIV